MPEPLSDFSLRDYWRIIHARRRTILWAVLLSVAAALTYNYVQVPTYRAKATIRINREKPNIAELDKDLRQPPEQPDYLETQYRILQSRTLARRVINDLHLHALPEFRVRLDGNLSAGFVNDRVSGAVDSVTTMRPDAEEQESLHPAIIDEYLDHLDIHPAKGTRLVDVAFESVDPALASRVANTLAEKFIEHNLESNWNATQKASAWLEKQLSTLQARLEASENELHDYATRHSILFVEERKNITTEKLAQLEEFLTRAEKERIQEQSRAMLVEDALRRGGDLPGSLTSETYQQLQVQLTDLKREHSQLQVTFAPGYPAVQRVQRQMEEIQKSLEAEKRRILDSVKESYELALNRERLLRREVENQRLLVNRLSDDFIQYDILKRDAETNRELYEGLLQRLKEAGISAGLRASNIAILDRAELPQRPYRPRKLLNLSLALLAGLLIGFAVAFIQENMNTLVRTPEDVEGMTGLSLLAVIPRSRSPQSDKVITETVEFGPISRQKAPAAANNGAIDRCNGSGRQTRAVWSPEPALSEAYRTLRSSVLLGWDDSMRRILVTSSQPQEGKTTISLNLACSLAQLGRRVLLVDADMRRPNCAKHLRVDPPAGLTDYLQGLVEIDQVITETSVENLSLTAAGRSHSAASDLLYSPRLTALLQQAGERFEHVVIDSPPSLVLSDARTISQMVEGVILVVSDETESAALMRTKQTFDEGGVRFLGFVMNRVNLSNLHYGYYRNYEYCNTYANQTEPWVTEDAAVSDFDRGREVTS